MLTNDKLKEECGVFGMLHSEQKDVSKYIYYGLSASSIEARNPQELRSVIPMVQRETFLITKIWDW